MSTCIVALLSLLEAATITRTHPHSQPPAALIVSRVSVSHCLLQSLDQQTGFIEIIVQQTEMSGCTNKMANSPYNGLTPRKYIPMRLALFAVTDEHPPHINRHDGPLVKIPIDGPSPAMVIVVLISTSAINNYGRNLLYDAQSV